jgi:TonB family protein
MGVTSPTLLKKNEPTYSPEAQTLQTTGVVHLSVVIETDGTPSSAQLIEGIGFGLDEQAAKAVKEWRFNPGSSDGKSVRVRARVDVEFKLQ